MTPSGNTQNFWARVFFAALEVHATKGKRQKTFLGQHSAFDKSIKNCFTLLAKKASFRESMNLYFIVYFQQAAKNFKLNCEQRL